MAKFCAEVVILENLITSMKNKVVLVYRDNEGEIAEETVWVQQVGENFKIDNIPFYAPNLSRNDLISVEDDEGTLYFDKLIEASGHSTVQVIFFKAGESERVLKSIEQLSCQWEGMKGQPYFAVDIPPNVNYKKVRQLLDIEFDNKNLDFKEACLSENHSRL
jgi:hypothetical protein